jgi:hypothetical protein
LPSRADRTPPEDAEGQHYRVRSGLALAQKTVSPDVLDELEEEFEELGDELGGEYDGYDRPAG